MLSEGRLQGRQLYREPVDISVSAQRAPRAPAPPARPGTRPTTPNGQPHAPGHTYSPGRGTRPEGSGNQQNHPPATTTRPLWITHPLPYVDDGPF